MGIAPPPGFVLDAPQAQGSGPAPLPPGFVLDAPGEAPAPAAGPSMLERAGDAALAVAFPHWAIGNAVMQQAARAGEQIMALPSQVMDALRTSATHYRTLAHGAGLPVDAPSPEDTAQYRSDVIDMLLTTGGGAAGRAIGNQVGSVAKYLGRGFRTPSGADRFLTREAAHIMPSSTSSGVGVQELLAPTLSSAVVGTGVDMMDPTPWELTDKPVAAGAGLATAAAVAKNTVDDLLIQNPRWRSIVMRGATGQPIMTAIGATLGYLAARGINMGWNEVDDVVKFMSGGEDEPAAAAPGSRGESMMGMMPGLGQESQAYPLPGPQSALPTELPMQMAGASDYSGPLPPREQTEQERMIQLLLAGNTG